MAKKRDIKKEIRSLIDDINSFVGKGTAISFDDGINRDIKTISSNSLALDYALGGGYPVGRIIEIYGAESSGKTTLTLEAISSYQKTYPDKAVMFLDVENAFDPQYAKNLGVDLSGSRMVFSQPGTFEDTFNVIEKGVESDIIGLIVVDSVAAMTPLAELEGEIGESKIGLQARLMSQSMRKLVGKVQKSDTMIFFTNQTRKKIGVMFGDPTTTPGGEALKFYASIRINTFKYKGVKDKSGELQSNILKAKVVKNKIAPPYREAELNIRFGEGIDKYTELIEYATELEIMNKKGSYFYYDGTNLGQGIENVRSTFVDNPELFEIIKELVKEKLD